MTMLQGLVEQATRNHHDALERACETALQTGTHGVLVEWHRDPITLDHTTGMMTLTACTISVTTDVPYGTIHEVRP